jgi:hypothetical protein
MSTVEVRTQAALDEALAKANPGDIIAIRGKGVFDLRASGSAVVRASDSAVVTAGKFVAVHLAASGRDRPTITGGVVIETPDVTDAETWVAYHGAQVTPGGMLPVWKALDDDWSTDSARRHGLTYAPGTEAVAAPDWQATAQCGNGLHASASPHDATQHNPTATRWVRCLARLDEVVVIDATKLKAPRLYGPFVAVDILDRAVTA